MKRLWASLFKLLCKLLVLLSRGSNHWGKVRRCHFGQLKTDLLMTNHVILNSSSVGSSVICTPVSSAHKCFWQYFKSHGTAGIASHLGQASLETSNRAYFHSSKPICSQIEVRVSKELLNSVGGWGKCWPHWNSLRKFKFLLGHVLVEPTIDNALSL